MTSDNKIDNHHHHEGPPPPSTKQIAGYFTVAGIVNEISLSESDWPRFALKELLDNAHDWLNDHYPPAINTKYSDSISKTTDEKVRREIAVRIRIEPIPNDPNHTRVFRIAVRNSNVNQKKVFGGGDDDGEEGLKHIFDYSNWHSTKRYHHRMTSGSLGDYLKRHGGMGYASWNNIAHHPHHHYQYQQQQQNSDGEEDNISNLQWKEPLIFRFNGFEYKVFVYYNRYTGESNSIIKYVGKSDAIDYTEVECALPVSRFNCNNPNPSQQTLFDRLYEYYSWYKIPKIDIKFSFDMKYGTQRIIESGNPTIKNVEEVYTTTQEQQHQQQQPSFSYYSDSVWRSTFSEFRDYINGIVDKSITLRSALDTFREIKCLQKHYYYYDTEKRYKTVQDIAYKHNQIKELFIALRKHMQPESLNLPFKIKDREQQLIFQLAKYTKVGIDLKKAHAKVITGHYSGFDYENNIDDRVFHYWIEVAIAPLTEFDSVEDAGKYDFIGAINGTPSLDSGISYFNDSGFYTWINKGGTVVGAHGILALLSACGFSEDTNLSQRRKASIIFLNLQTPCPEW
jgi:hypothetical protein